MMLEQLERPLSASWEEQRHLIRFVCEEGPSTGTTWTGTT